MSITRHLLLAVVASCTLTSCGGGGSDTPIAIAPPPTVKPGVLSISVSPRQVPPPTTQDYLDAFMLGKNAGVRGQFTSMTWSDVEPTFGAAYNFSRVTDAINFASKQHGYALLIGIQVINTNLRAVPTNLAAIAFDNVTFRNQFKAMLTQMIPLFEGRVRYLSIGNEVDVLLSSTNEWAAYKVFYDDVAAHARALDPNLRVGVTLTADFIIGNGTLAATLNTSSDVVMTTYYPLTTNFAVRPAASPMTDFPVLLTRAGSKQLVFQEVGYPSAPSLGSSQAQQAAFVNNVFEQWKNSGGRIPFLNYFLLHDLTPQLCDSLATQYGLPNVQNFKDYLCTLGLRTVDGVAKTGWGQFVTASGSAELP